jgi:hypothetical protein
MASTVRRPIGLSPAAGDSSEVEGEEAPSADFPSAGLAGAGCAFGSPDVCLAWPTGLRPDDGFGSGGIS